MTVDQLAAAIAGKPGDCEIAFKALSAKSENQEFSTVNDIHFVAGDSRVYPSAAELVAPKLWIDLA